VTTLTKIFSLLALPVLFGCTSTETFRSNGSKVGKPIISVLRDSVGHRIEIYGEANVLIEEILPQPGSVSVYRLEPTGQDNYEFDEFGVIIRHQRSYGDDYLSGAWSTVE
jgi:hypothetical protein